MPNKDILLITSDAYNLKHGTGVQHRSYFDARGDRCAHLYFGKHYGASDVDWSAHVPAIDFTSSAQKHLRRQVKRLILRSKGRDIWNGRISHERLAPRRFCALAKRMGIKPEVAYVCVLTADHAALALQIVRNLKVPYLVHFMDVIDAKTGDPQRWRDLFGGAECVVGITPELTQFAIEHGARRTLEIPIGFPPDHHAKVRYPRPEGVRLFCTGRVTPESYLVFDEALEGTEFVEAIDYVGPEGEMIPTMVHPVRNRGFMDDEAYAQAIAESDIGVVLLTLSDPLFARFSFPSRLIRLLGAGLPCVVVVHPDSAVAKWAAMQDSPAVRCASTSEEIRAALRRITNDIEACSTEALKVASRFSTEQSVNAISDILADVTQGRISLQASRQIE